MKNTLILITMLVFTFNPLQAGHFKNITLKDNLGETYNVKTTENGLKFDIIGDKVIFLELFGHNCPPCIASIPRLIKLQNKYKNDLSIVAIEVQGHNNKELTDFKNDKGINYITIAEKDAEQLVDYIVEKTEWEGHIPFLLVIDKKGEVQILKMGLTSYEELEEMIQSYK